MRRATTALATLAIATSSALVVWCRTAPPAAAATSASRTALLVSGTCEGYLETGEDQITYVVCLNTGCVATCGTTAVYSETFGDNAFACGCSGVVPTCCHLVWTAGGSGPEWTGEGDCDYDCQSSGSCFSTPHEPNTPMPPLVEAYCDDP